MNGTTDVATTAVGTTVEAATAAAGTDAPVDPYRGVTGLVYDLTAVYLGLLTVFGIANNVLVLVLYARYRTLRNPINLFLVNISLGDLSVSVLGSPFTFASSVARRWLFGSAGCVWYAFIVTVCGVEQIVALAAVSVHRCCLIVRPLTAQKMTTAWAVLFICLTWTYSLIVSLPPAVGWNSFVVEGIGTACSVDWTSADFSDSSYIIFIFIMVLVIPLSLIIGSYTLLIYAVKKISGSEAAQTSQHKAEKRVTLLVVVMITFFLLAWTPYAIFSLYLSISHNHHISPVLAALPAMFAKSCTVYNPIIYFLMNQQFKNALVDMVFCGRNPFQRDEVESRGIVPGMEVDGPEGRRGRGRGRGKHLPTGTSRPPLRGDQPCSSCSPATQLSEIGPGAPASLGPLKIADWGAKATGPAPGDGGPAAPGDASAAAVTTTKVEAFQVDPDPSSHGSAEQESQPRPAKKPSTKAIILKRGKVGPALPSELPDE